jgi:hypothetical protein
MFQFATCDTKRAYEFIKRFHDVTEAEIADLLELIRQDKARVLDPDFHSPCQVVLGKNGADSDIPTILAACAPLAQKKAKPND